MSTDTPLILLETPHSSGLLSGLMEDYSRTSKFCWSKRNGKHQVSHLSHRLHGLGLYDQTGVLINHHVRPVWDSEGAWYQQFGAEYGGTETRQHVPFWTLMEVCLDIWACSNKSVCHIQNQVSVPIISTSPIFSTVWTPAEQNLHLKWGSRRQNSAQTGISPALNKAPFSVEYY